MEPLEAVRSRGARVESPLKRKEGRVRPRFGGVGGGPQYRISAALAGPAVSSGSSSSSSGGGGGSDISGDRVWAPTSQLPFLSPETPPCSPPTSGFGGESGLSPWGWGGGMGVGVTQEEAVWGWCFWTDVRSIFGVCRSIIQCHCRAPLPT